MAAHSFALLGKENLHSRGPNQPLGSVGSAAPSECQRGSPCGGISAASDPGLALVAAPIGHPAFRSFKFVVLHGLQSLAVPRSVLRYLTSQGLRP